MKLLQVALLEAFVAFATVTNIPFREYNPNTKPCVEWYNNYMEDTCENIRRKYGITPEEFTAWNPQVSLNCEPWWPVSYCILSKEKYLKHHESQTVTTSTTISTTSTISPTSTTNPTSTISTNRGSSRHTGIVFALRGIAAGRMGV